jgi:asparagine synthase (glutamine-hydrolysing)
MKMNLYDGILRFVDGEAEFSGGAQAVERERGVSVMFCGSFYNLRDMLPGNGSPVQAVLERYLKDGSLGFLRDIDGAFAVAVYDRKLRRLLVARDRLGTMPMFYFLGNNGFYFAHTLSMLRRNSAVPSEIDLQAVHDYLALQYVPCPRTLYRDVWKMRPGTVLSLSLDDHSIQFKPYWEPDFSQIDRSITAGEAIWRFRELLDASVARRLSSINGNYAALLSGGLDSTIITGVVARHTDGPLPTLTMGFPHPDYDERDRAEFAVGAINREIKTPLDHRVRVIEPDNFQLFEELVRDYGEPYADASLLPTHLLCRWAGEENMAAAFNGDAADELFAGYERYLVMRYAGYFRAVPRWVFKAAAAVMPKGGNERSRKGRALRACRALGAAPAERYLDIISRFSEERRLELYGARFDGFSPAPTYRIIAEAEKAASGRHIVERMQEVDMRTYMPGDVLPKAVIASQAAGIDGLAPFLDNAVMDFAMTLPLHLKQNGFSRKHLLKIAYSEFVPPRIAGQRKKGFGVPVGEWLRTSWHEQMCAHLLEGKLVRQGYFDRAGLERMMMSHQRREADYSYPLWSLMVLDLFL